MTLKERNKLAWLAMHVSYPIPNLYTLPGFTPNGCGPECWRSGLVRLLMNHPLGMPDIEVCGDLHDYLYFKGGSEAEREFADQELRRLMRELCPFGWSPHRAMDWWRMRGLSDAYYLAVHFGGREYFNYGADH